MTRFQLAAIAGAGDPFGTWACYYTSAHGGEFGVVAGVIARYTCREQAEAAVALACMDLTDPMCGYAVRRLDGDRWVECE